MLQTTIGTVAPVSVPATRNKAVKLRKPRVQRDLVQEAEDRVLAFLPEAPAGRIRLDRVEPEIQYSGGPGTWRAFMAEVNRERNAMARNLGLKPGKYPFSESWNALRTRAPSGWNGPVPVEVNDMDCADWLYVQGVRKECVVVFDPESHHPVGFVSYRLKVNSWVAGSSDDPDADPCPENEAKKLDATVHVDLVYLLPSFRKKGFGRALTIGLADRIIGAVVTGYESLSYPRRFRRLGRIALDADCCTDSGLHWMEWLEHELDLDMAYQLGKKHSRRCPVVACEYD